MVRRVVRDIASRVPRSVDRDELLSAGMLGLAQAQRSFRPDTGVPFEVHARGRVTGAILDDLRSRDWLTRPQRARARLVLDTIDSLPSPTTDPTVGRVPEIAQRSRLKPAEVRQTLADLDRSNRLQQSVGLVDSPGAHEVAGSAPDPLAEVLDRELIEHVRRAVAELPTRLRRVIEAVYFEERQMQALAAEMGVSPSRVSQMCAEGLGRLKLAINTLDRSVAAS